MVSNKYRKIPMKFNISQLERIIIAVLTNAFNVKFVSNVKRLFSYFDPNSYKTEYTKEVRVYIISQLTDIILTHKITDKETILGFLDTDGKYYNDSVELLNKLYDEELSENELALLDKTVSNQLKFNVLVENSKGLSDILLDLNTSNYDDIEEIVEKLENGIDVVNRDIRSARESIEDSKKDLSLSNSGFVNTLGNIISKERNPSYKIKTGIQYLNAMFNGGFEPGQHY